MNEKWDSERKIESLKKRLEAYSVRNERGCLIWQRYKNKKGYGRIGHGHQYTIFVHHAAWLVHTGQCIPKNKLLLHTCDTPSCHEISHLYLGTASKNTEDMMNRGRHKRVTHNPDGYVTSKLNAVQVKEIKEMFKNGILPKDIAPKFGVSISAIYDIRLGRTWHYQQQENK